MAKGNTYIGQADVRSGAVLESENLTGEGFSYVTIAQGLKEDTVQH